MAAHPVLPSVFFMHKPLSRRHKIKVPSFPAQPPKSHQVVAGHQRLFETRDPDDLLLGGPA